MLSIVFAETMLHARSTCHETRYGEQISWLCDVPVEDPMYLAMSAESSLIMPSMSLGCSYAPSVASSTATRFRGSRQVLKRSL